MRLLFDGVEVPWPKEIVIEVDPGGETAGPLQITITGGRLVVSPHPHAALTITAVNGGQLLLGDSQVTHDVSADAPVFVPAGRQ